MRIPVHFIPGWKRLMLLAIPLALALGGVAAAYLYSSFGATAQAQGPVVAPGVGAAVPPAAGLLIDVSGAVQNPGLYRLPRGDRVYDAIAAAGGLSPDADTSKLPNLAGRLKDGEVGQL